MEDQQQPTAKDRQREALARAKEFAKVGDTNVPGRVEGVAMDAKCSVGTRTALCYYYFDQSEIADGRARKLRDSLERRGYWHVEDSGAYVVGVPTAEIWATTWEASSVRFDADLERHTKARRATRPKGVFTPQ